MEIDGDYGIALARHNSGIPAGRPAIAERALRPTMNKQHRRDGPLLVLEPGNLAPDRVAARAFEAEPRRDRRGHFSHPRCDDIGQRPGFLAL